MASVARTTSERISMPLLENGLDFLASTVEHLSGQPTHRDLKYALLHLASGIELVLKERLRQQDPAQLYQQPAKFEASDFALGKFKSANTDVTVKRLASVAGVEVREKDFAQIKALRDKRNRVEHFGLDDTTDAVSAVTARALGFALDFIAAELDTAALGFDASEQLRSIREALPQLQSFVADRRRSIANEINAATTAVVECARCREDASVLIEGARCRFCGYYVAPTEGAEEYAHAIIGVSHYDAAHDGFDWVVSTCPGCEDETLVDRGLTGDAGPGVRWICFSCGDYWHEGALWNCDLCNALITAGEGEMTVCGDCFEGRMRAWD